MEQLEIGILPVQPRAYPKIAEYRDIKNAPHSVFTVVEKRMKEGREYTFYSTTAGYECAGAMARWTDGVYGIRFMCNNSWNGRRFTLDHRKEAEELFNKWTNPETEGR